MFVKTPDRPRAVPPELAARIRPVVAAAQRLLPVPEPLRPLLPDGALRRGATLSVTGPAATGSVTLALALLAGVSAAGGWCAAVGLPGPGAVAMAELGLDLSRLALVPRPGPAWAEVAAELLDGVDAVLLRPPLRPRPTAARHLSARARERRTVLVVLGPWPPGPDVTLEVGAASWEGLADGHGHLARRRAEVTVAGRRDDRPHRHRLWLPCDGGAVAAG